MTQKKDTVSAPTAPTHSSALGALREELMGMPSTEVDRGLRLDATASSRVAVSTAKKLEAHRADLVAQFGAKAGTLLDGLPLLGRAAAEVDIELIVTAPQTDLSPLHEAVRESYLLVLTDCESLARRKFLDPACLEAARDVNGYSAIVRSVLVLVRVLRERWAELEAHTPLERGDLDRAEAAALALSTAVADRDYGVLRAPAIELRARVLTKLVQQYEELRRMVTYLRWYQEDADALCPSLWANRGRRGRSSDEARGETPEPGEAPEVVTPGPINGPGPFTS